MKPNFPAILSGIILSTMLSPHVHAAEKEADEHEHHETEQHGSHEHGQARLTIATTKTGLEIMLETPAANIFGFEHKAGNEDEHHIVHEAAKKLNAGEALFVADKAAGCALDKAEISSDIIDQHDKEKHADEDDAHHHDHDDKKSAEDEDHAHEKESAEDKDHHEHDEHDKKESAEDEDHDHEHHDESDSTHNDVDVTWVFKCQQTESVSQLETHLFKTFPKGFERLNVEWITAETAGAVQLETDGVIEFK